MAKTPAQKQREYRVRQAVKSAPAKAASNRLYRLLVDHPAKLAKFEMFMLSMNREIRDAQRSTAQEKVELG